MKIIENYVETIVKNILLEIDDNEDHENLGYSEFLGKDIYEADLQELIKIGNKNKEKLIENIRPIILQIKNIQNIYDELEIYINSFKQGQIVIDPQNPSKIGYTLPQKDEKGPIKYFVGNDLEIRTKIFRIFLKFAMEYLKFLKLYQNMYNPLMETIEEIGIEDRYSINYVRKSVKDFENKINNTFIIPLNKHLSELKVRNPNMEGDQFVNNIINKDSAAFKKDLIYLETEYDFKIEKLTPKFTNKDIEYLDEENINITIIDFITKIFSIHSYINDNNFYGIYNFVLGGFGDKADYNSNDMIEKDINEIGVFFVNF